MSNKYFSIETYAPDPKVRYEKTSDKIMTVVGESYTLEELYARHMNGHQPSVGKETFFEDTDDFESIDLSKIKRMDIFDRKELYIEVKSRAQKALKKIEAYKKAQEEPKVKDSDERSGEAPQKPQGPQEPAKAESPPVST